MKKCIPLQVIETPAVEEAEPPAEVEEQIAARQEMAAISIKRGAAPSDAGLSFKKGRIINDV